LKTVRIAGMQAQKIGGIRPVFAADFINLCQEKRL
jgi:hypothetical protein